MRVFLKIFFPLAAIVMAFGMWLGRSDLDRMTADATKGDAAVWVYTPHVAPGDTIVLGVSVSGGEDIGIQQVLVHDGSNQHSATGSGQDWGDTITTRGAPSSAEDSLDVNVTVPRDARPGTTLRLVVDVSYVVATQWSPSSFSNSADAEQLTIEVEVRSPAGAAFHRMLSALWALGLLAAICAVLYLGIARFDRWLTRNEDIVGDGEMFALFMLTFVVFNTMFIGRALFALPLVAATGTTSTTFFIVACLLWTIIPIVACVYGYKHGKARAALSPLEVRAVEGRPVVDPGDPYRAEPDARTDVVALSRRAEDKPTTLAALADALRGAGLAVTRQKKRILIDGGDGKGPSTMLQARDPERVTVGTLVLRNRDMREALVVLHAALPLLGPVELRLPVGNFLIDQRKTRDQLRAELDEALQALVAQVKQSLRPLDVASLLRDKPGTLR